MSARSSSIVKRLVFGGALLVAPMLILTASPGMAAETTVRAPAAAFNPPSAASSETAVLAGGCFWGLQGVYSHVKGVTSVVSGFTGGAAGTAHYERVSEGDTGHAESVKITFDPRVVRYADLLRVFFSVVADPTQLNYQGNDHGTQYRTAIFPQNAEQAKIAGAYIKQLSAAKLWKRPIVTKIEAAKPFYPAESYHQDYLYLHPESDYIHFVDIPKVEALKATYPQLWRDKPVLVRDAKA